MYEVMPSTHTSRFGRDNESQITPASIRSEYTLTLRYSDHEQQIQNEWETTM
jgi:hypothetical protein